MPRPLVEIRQAVLNPVVTINDPQQAVCIVGLHTDDYTDKEVHQLDRPISVSAGSVVHFSAATLMEFTIDADGVLIDSAVDMGPDEYDIPAELTLKLSSAYVAKRDLPNLYNGTFTGAGTLTPTVNVLSIPAASSIATLPADVIAGSFVYAQPEAAHCNKLVVSQGSALDFTTHDYFSDLQNGDALYLGGDTFYVLRKEADAIYLRGNDVGSHELLVATTNIEIQATEGGATVVSLDKHRFDLVHPGVHSAKVVPLGTSTTKLEITPAMPFIIRESAAATASGTLLNPVPSSDLEDLAIAEAVDSMTVVTSTSGDATITVDKDKLVANGDPIVKASFTMSYTVAKTKHSAGLVQVDANTLEAILGAPTPRNPLSLAAQLALLNSGASSISVLALNISPPEGTTELRSLETAFVDALSLLNRHATVYAMVPLTTNTTVLKSYANAAEAMSSPTKGKFRICLGSSKGAPSQDFIIGSESSPARLGSNSVGNQITNGAGDLYNLPSNRVLEGDAVVATDSAGSVYLGSVSAVDSNTAVTVSWEATADPAGAKEFTGYYIGRSLTSTAKISRQIEILTAEATSIASKRLFLTFPGACTVTSGALTYSGMPSYYLTAAFSGMLARLEIHRPKNYLGLIGVSNLEAFSRFSDEQLDQISDAGYLVFQQEEATSAPFCVHQVNTYHGVQAGTQEFTELSVLANFDFVSRYMKEILDPFAGTVNIVPSTLGLIRASLEAGVDNLIARRVATIGAPLLSGSIQYIRQASYDQGTVEASVLVSLPKVLNKIILEVVSG